MGVYQVRVQRPLIAMQQHSPMWGPVAADIPTPASKPPGLSATSDRDVPVVPFDTAARSAIQVQEQLQLGLLQAPVVAAEELWKQEAKAKQRAEVPFGAPFTVRETAFDGRLRRVMLRVHLRGDTFVRRHQRHADRWRW
jgi:hypothetical protein